MKDLKNSYYFTYITSAYIIFSITLAEMGFHSLKILRRQTQQMNDKNKTEMSVVFRLKLTASTKSNSHFGQKTKIKTKSNLVAKINNLPGKSNLF